MDNDLIRNGGTPRQPESTPITPAFNPGQMINPSARRHFGRDQLGGTGNEGYGSGVTDEERAMIRQGERQRADAAKVAEANRKAQDQLAADAVKQTLAARNESFDRMAKAMGRPAMKDEVGLSRFADTDEDAAKAREERSRQAFAGAKEAAAKERQARMEADLKRAKWAAEDPVAQPAPARDREAIAAKATQARTGIATALGLDPSLTDDDLEKHRAAQPGIFGEWDAARKSIAEDDAKVAERDKRARSVREIEGRLAGVIPDEPLTPFQIAARRNEFAARTQAHEEDRNALDMEAQTAQDEYLKRIEQEDQRIAQARARGGTASELLEVSRAANIEKLRAETERNIALAGVEERRGGKIKEWADHAARTELFEEQVGLWENASATGDPVEPVEKPVAPQAVSDGKEYAVAPDMVTQKQDDGTQKIVGKPAIGADGKSILLANDAESAQDLMRSAIKDRPIYIKRANDTPMSDDEVKQTVAAIEERKKDSDYWRERNWSEAYDKVAKGQMTPEQAQASVDEAAKKSFEMLNASMTDRARQAMVDFSNGVMSAQQLQEVWAASGMEGSALDVYKGLESESKKAEDATRELVEKSKASSLQPDKNDLAGFKNGGEFLAALYKWKADPEGVPPEQAAAFERLEAKRDQFEMQSRLELESKGITGEQADEIMQRAAMEGYTFREKTMKDVGAESSWQELIPFWAGAYEVQKVLPIAKTAWAMEHGDEVSPEQKEALEAYIIDISREPTWQAQWFQVLKALPAFGLELLTTSGLYSAGRKAGTKAVIDALERVTKKKSLELLKRKAADGLGKRALRWAGRTGIRGLGVAAGGTLQAPVAAITRIPAGMARDMVNQGFESGRLKLEPKEIGEYSVMVDQGVPGTSDIMEAFNSSFVDNWVEVVSEHSGGSLGRLAAPLLPKALRGATLNALRKLNGGKSAQQIRKFIGRVGWNGVVEEMWEERVGEAMRGVAHKASGGKVGEEWKLPTLQQLGVELASFMVPGTAIGAANKAYALLNLRGPKAAVNTEKARFDTVTGSSPEKMAETINTRLNGAGEPVTPENVKRGLDLFGGKVENLGAVRNADARIKDAEEGLARANAEGDVNKQIAYQELIARMHTSKREGAMEGVMMAATAAEGLSAAEQDIREDDSLTPEDKAAQFRDVERVRGILKLSSGMGMDSLTESQRKAIETPLRQDEAGNEYSAVDLTDKNNPIVTDEGIALVDTHLGPELRSHFVQMTETQAREAIKAKEAKAKAQTTKAKPANAPDSEGSQQSPPSGGTQTTQPAPAGTKTVTARSKSGKTSVSIEVPSTMTEGQIEKNLQRELVKKSGKTNEFLDRDSIKATENAPAGPTTAAPTTAQPAKAADKTQAPDKGKSGSQPKQGTQASEKGIPRVDRARVLKSESDLADAMAPVVAEMKAAGIDVRLGKVADSGLASADHARVYFDLRAIWKESQKLPEDKRAQWLDRLVSEELRHHALRRAILEKWNKAPKKTRGSYDSFAGDFFLRLWEQEIAGTPLEKVVNDAYLRLKGAKETNLVKALKAEEAVRMVAQQLADGEITEELHQFVKNAPKDFLDILRGIIDVLKSLVKGDTTALGKKLRESVDMMESELNKIFAGEPATAPTKKDTAAAKKPGTKKESPTPKAKEGAPNVLTNPSDEFQEGINIADGVRVQFEKSRFSNSLQQVDDGPFPVSTTGYRSIQSVPTLGAYRKLVDETSKSVKSTVRDAKKGLPSKGSATDKFIIYTVDADVGGMVTPDTKGRIGLNRIQPDQAKVWSEGVGRAMAQLDAMRSEIDPNHIKSLDKYLQLLNDAGVKVGMPGDPDKKPTTKKQGEVAQPTETPETEDLPEPEIDDYLGSIPAIEGFEEGLNRFKETGATDKELLEFLGDKFGNQGGGSVSPKGKKSRFITVKGGSVPRVWFKSGATGKPDLKGQPLVDAIRKLHGIGSRTTLSPRDQRWLRKQINEQGFTEVTEENGRIYLVKRGPVMLMKQSLSSDQAEFARAEIARAGTPTPEGEKPTEKLQGLGTRDAVNKAWADGYTIFASPEADEEMVEIESFDMLEAYTPDSLAYDPTQKNLEPKELPKKTPATTEPVRQIPGQNYLGKNNKGSDLYEDAKGVRSYMDDGYMITESVYIIPGKGTQVDSIEKKSPEYLTVEELTERLERRKESEKAREEARKEVDHEATPAQKEAENHKVGRIKYRDLNISIENALGSFRWKLDLDRLEQVAERLQTSGGVRGAEYARKIRKNINLLTSDNSGTEAAFINLGLVEQDLMRSHPPIAEVVSDILAEGWYNKMPADYGRILGTEGADGDHVDAFIGKEIDSPKAFIIDQFINGKFDEHKIMLGFDSLESAKKTYLAAYEKGWELDNKNIKEVDWPELKQWLDSGDMTKPFGNGNQDNPADEPELDDGEVDGIDSVFENAITTDLVWVKRIRNNSTEDFRIALEESFVKEIAKRIKKPNMTDAQKKRINEWTLMKGKLVRAVISKIRKDNPADPGSHRWFFQHIDRFPLWMQQMVRDERRQFTQIGSFIGQLHAQGRIIPADREIIETALTFDVSDGTESGKFWDIQNRLAGEHSQQEAEEQTQLWLQLSRQWDRLGSGKNAPTWASDEFLYGSPKTASTIFALWMGVRDNYEEHRKESGKPAQSEPEVKAPVKIPEPVNAPEETAVSPRPHHGTKNGLHWYFDTPAITAAERAGWKIDHLGFGDFGAKKNGMEVDFFRQTDDSNLISDAIGREHRLSGKQEHIDALVTDLGFNPSGKSNAEIAKDFLAGGRDAILPEAKPKAAKKPAAAPAPAPQLSEAEKQLGDLFGDIPEASRLPGASELPEFYKSRSFPADKFGPLLAIVQSLRNEGKTTPADLAETLTKLNRRAFSQSAWSAYLVLDAKLDPQPDWVAIYDSLDAANRQPDVEEEGDTDETETGVREGNQGSKRRPGRTGSRQETSEGGGRGADVEDGMPPTGDSGRAGGDSVGTGERPDGSGVGSGENPTGGVLGEHEGGGKGTDSVGSGHGGGVPFPPHHSPGRGNYHLTDPERIAGGGPKARFRRNKEALEIAESIEQEGREPTQEELDTLAGYTGWGALSQELFRGTWDKPIFVDGWKDENLWLRDHLGEQAWRSANQSVLNAHYTDPYTMETMWNMVLRAGFLGGRILEPGEGVGGFWASMPPELRSVSDMTGIELDRATSRIAKILHPETNHFQMPYQDSHTADNFYDLVIGNWPFAKESPADRRYNHLNLPLHDYYFAKALDQTRPGGLVIGITTHFTMDKKSTAARRYLASRGELVAAYRMPSGTFGKFAGTKVVTDIIILKKRPEPIEDLSKETWIESEEVEDTASGGKYQVNEYYRLNPRNILGRIGFGRGTTSGQPGLIVDMLPDFEEQLRALPNRIPEGIFTPWEPGKDTAARIRTVQMDGERIPQNSIVVRDGEIYRVAGEHLEDVNDIVAWKVKDAKKTAARLREMEGLIALRDKHAELMRTYKAGGDTDNVRKELKNLYDAFKKDNKLGLLRDAGMLRIMEKASDPAAFTIVNLEDEHGRPRAILTQEIMRPALPDTLGSIEDAYAVHRNSSLGFDAAAIAELAGVPEKQVYDRLEETNQIYRIPDGSYEHRDVYLSGNVRRKLREAVAAKKSGVPGMDRNIAALEEVQPPLTHYSEIEVRMGAPWISKDDYRSFYAELLAVPEDGISEAVEVIKQSSGWKIKVEHQYATSSLALDRWGMRDRRVPFYQIANHAINGTAMQVWDEDADGNKFPDTEATYTANEKIEALREEFQDWIWRDADRTARLAYEFNEATTSTIAAKHDGSHLRMPGLALKYGNDEFSFRKHQIDAVWRAIVDGRLMGYHEVGTGKTFTMAGICIEGRRLGRFRKPLLFAHNANHYTVAADFRAAYPSAKILHFDSISKEDRASKLRQIQMDDWDAIIVPHSMIDKFTLSRASMDALAQKQIQDLEDEFWQAIEDMEDHVNTSNIDLDDMATVNQALAYKTGASTAKELAKARERIMARIAKKASEAPEDAIYFEDLGVDAILIDEAHIFKKINLATRKNIKGLNKIESGRGFSLSLLTDHLKSRTGGKGVFTFTGTPVTNSLNEVFNMMKFVMDDQMKEAGISSFDDWFNMFADTVVDAELTSGGTYESVERLLSFINVPELARLAGRSFDVVMAEDMVEFKPREEREGLSETAKGVPYRRTRRVIAEMSEAQAEHSQSIKQRYTNFKGLSGRQKRLQIQSGGDSPLLMETEGSDAALDLRLVDRTAADHPGSKVNLCVRNILEIYRENPEQTTQMVFLEGGFTDYADRKKTVKDPETGRALTTNDGKKIYRTERVPKFNILRDMVQKLVDGGMRPDQIAVFSGMKLDTMESRPNDVLRQVHQIKGKITKEDLAAKMRTGEIKVAFGGSETMGTGVNAQNLLRALHHLDAPWMPGHLEQREGRGVRQGNRWNTVEVLMYLTEGSHDARRWQVLLNKVRFIYRFNQMLRNRGVMVRVLEGDGADTTEDGSLGDFEEAFSAAAGDPRLLLKANLQKQVNKLEKRRDTHLRNQEQARRTISESGREIAGLQEQIRKVQMDADAYKEMADQPFEITVTDGKNTRTFATRTEAEEFWNALPTRSSKDKTDRLVGTLGAFKIYQVPSLWSEDTVYIEAVGPGGMRHSISKLTMGSVEGKLRNLSGRVKDFEKEINQLQAAIGPLTEMAHKPFPREDDLTKKQEALGKIETELAHSPVPAPAWLRHGAPTGSLIYVDGKPMDVLAHRWDKNGYWILIEEEDGTVRPIPYEKATDSQGTRLLEDVEFTAPPEVKAPPPNPDQIRNMVRNMGRNPGRSNPGSADPQAGSLPEFDPNDRTMIPDDVEGIRAAMREVLGIMPTEAIAELKEIGLSEEPGERTVANPAIANPEITEEGRRHFDAVRVAYEGQLEAARETQEQWISEARERLEKDRGGVMRELTEKARMGEPFNKWEVKAAQILINQMRAKAFSSNNPDYHKTADILSYGFQRSGTEQARALAARRDPFKSPAERHLDVINRMLIELPPDQERVIGAHWAPGVKARKIENLQRQIEQARSQVDPNKVKELEAELAVAKSRGDQSDARSRLLAQRNAKIRKFLKEGYGVTMQEIFNGEAVVRLRGSKIVAKVLNDNFTPNQAKAIRESIIDGGGDRAAARNNGVGRTEEIRALQDKFRRLMRRRFTELAKRGFTLEDFTHGDDKFFPANTSELPDLSEDDVKNAVEAMMEALFVDDGARNAQRVKKIDSTGKGRVRKGQKLDTKRFDAGDRKQVAKMLRSAQAEVDGNGFDMLYEYWISGILSGPQTQAVNIAGNTANLVFEYGVQRWLEMAWNTIIGSKSSPQVGELRYMRRAMPGLFATALQYAKEAWDTEQSFFDEDFLNESAEMETRNEKMESRRGAIPDRILNMGTPGGRSLPGAIAGAVTGKGWSGVSVGRTVRMPGRALLWADTFFKALIAQLEVHVQAYRIGTGLGIKGEALDDFMAEQMLSGSESWHAAIEKAKELTFTDTLRTYKQGGGTMEAMARWVMDMRRRKTFGPLVTFALGFFFPFIQTPFRIFQAGLRRTPLGLLGIAKIYGSGLYQMKKGVPFFESVPQSRIARDLADQTIAFVTTALLWSLSEGDPDDDDKPVLFTGSHPFGVETTPERDASQRINGGPYMLRIGTRENGVWMDYGRIEPLATTLATVIDAIRGAKRARAGKPAGQEMMNLFHYGLAQATEKTFLKGASSLYEFINSPDRSAGTVPKFLASAIVPNLIRQPLRNLDSYAREYRTAPWYYHALPVGDFAAKRIDIYGNPVRKEGTPLEQIARGGSYGEFMRNLDPWLRTIWDVGYQKSDTINPLDRAMREFSRRNPGEGYFPARNTVDRYRNPATGKLDMPMTREQYEFFALVAGRQFSEAATASMNQTDMVAPTDETVKKARDARSGVFPRVRNELFNGGTPPFIPQKTKSMAEILGLK